MANIRTVLGSDPKLTPLGQRVDVILSDYNRNQYRDLPNDQYIDHNKKRNQDSLIVADQTFHRDNRYPPLSYPPEIGRTSTVKVITNDQNVMTRFDVEKEFQGDKVNVVQIKQADPVSSSSYKKRPTRTPAKQQVDVYQNNLVQNPDYDPNNLVRSYIHHEEVKEASGRKIIFANDTDPSSGVKKRPPPVERLIVVQNPEIINVSPAPPKPRDEPVERVIITSNDYRDPHPQPRDDKVIVISNDQTHNAPQPRPQPFQQYPVYDKIYVEPYQDYRHPLQQYWEFSPYYARPRPAVQVLDRRYIEPEYDVRDHRRQFLEFSPYYARPRPTVQVLERRTIEPDYDFKPPTQQTYLEFAPYIPRSGPTRTVVSKLEPRILRGGVLERRDASIPYPAQYFRSQPVSKQVPIEDGNEELT
jgi:hypothetical protein